MAFIQSCEAQPSAGPGTQSAVVAGGETVGVAGFHALDLANRSGEIGYWLAAAARGRGIMTRAVHGLIDHGFRLTASTASPFMPSPAPAPAGRLPSGPV